MKIVYNELVTVESNLHKAYYQVEDFDLNEWNNAFESAREEDESISDSMNWEYDSENKNVIVTIEADKQSASDMANTLMSSCLTSSFEDFEISKSDDDYVVFSFSARLSGSFLQSIFGVYDPIERHQFKNVVDSFKEEVHWEGWMNCARNWGLEKFLGYLSIRLDPDSLKKGLEILNTGSASDFKEWIYSVASGMEKPDETDIYYKFVTTPIGDSFFPDVEESNDDIDSFYKKLSICRKSYAKEYNSWRKLDRLQRSKYRMSSSADILYREKLSLEGVFSFYDSFIVDFFDYLFRAMNSKLSVMKMNQDIVDKINKFPNPRLAEIANERYKEYRKWDRNCLDLEFKSIHPKIEQVGEKHANVLDEVAELISDKSLTLPENYSFRDEKWFSQEMVSDVPCMHLKSSIKSEDGRNKSEDGRKFCILLNAMAKLGYVEDNEENLKLMAQALSGFGNEGYKPVMLRKRNGTGTTSRAIWFLLQEIVDFSTPEGKREKGEDYGSKYEIAKNLFNFRDWDEQNYFTKTERNSRNPGQAKEDIKSLLKIIYDIKPSPKKKKIRSK